MGYAFAWLPKEHIREELQSGILSPLSLREGGTREILFYLVLANPAIFLAMESDVWRR